MSTNSTPAANSGVHTITGMEFQINCALYLFLDDYKKFENSIYFLSIEHHEDFLFCFLNNHDIVTGIDSYQAKKNSLKWDLNETLIEILEKIAQVGISLKNDPIAKTASYYHNLHFITNCPIHLKAKIPKQKKHRTKIVNETDRLLCYNDLPREIQEKISTDGRFEKQTDKLSELPNLKFAFIDLNRTAKVQRQLLIGKFEEVFKGQVNDCAAAVDTLLKRIREVASIFNQGNIPKLLDESKRISSRDFNQILNLITKKKLGYVLWREEKKDICNRLQIPIDKREEFEQHYEYSLDLFKDKTQTEHQRIIQFVEKNRNIISTNTDEVTCLSELVGEFKKNYNSRLLEIPLKAAIYAAYIQITR